MPKKDISITGLTLPINKRALISCTGETGVEQTQLPLGFELEGTCFYNIGFSWQVGASYFSYVLTVN